MTIALARLSNSASNVWPQVLAEHRSWLTTVIYTRLRDANAVDEVLQETALAATRSTSMAKDREGISRWLYRVALRQSLLYVRRQSRGKDRLERLSLFAPQQDRREPQDPYQLMVASEQKDLVRKALGRLCSRDCQVLMLKYTEDWSCREMAKRLDVSEGAIKSRLLRARSNLRRELLQVNEQWDLP